MLNSWAILEPLWTFPPAQGVVAPEGYHEPSLQRKDADASSHLRQMLNGEWRLNFTAGESGEILGLLWAVGSWSSYPLVMTNIAMENGDV